MSVILVLIGAVVCMASGLPALVRSRWSGLTLTLILAGSAVGFCGALLGLVRPPAGIAFPWQVPGGALALRIDALSAFFVAPVFLLAGLGGVYGERYWPAGQSRGGYVRMFFGLMAGALALVMSAANTILFLAGWEIVAVSSFFLIATDHEREESRDAAWIYLAASHVATLSLFAIIVLLHTVTGSWTFTALPLGSGGSPRGWVVLSLALIAFGIKAGLMPFHIWLPAAHAAAPSHVSSLMSGVAIKMGIYGLVRLLSLFDVLPPAFGMTLLVAGIASSILGVAFALAQHDLKRLLAYHSIENIGIIVTGLGIALVAQAHGQPFLALLGYAGALLHVWNHGLFKALLFLSAGAVIHTVHTREMDRMGGLARRMPWTSAAFLLGAAAITGLPPLNGFVSEWLLYMAGMMSMTSTPAGGALALVLVVPALTLTGALALGCFVKAFGAAFLGAPRTVAAADASEVPMTMRAAMAPLAVCCILIGLLPAVFAPVLSRAVQSAAPRLAVAQSMSALLQPIQISALILMAASLAAFIALRVITRRARAAVTWDCGYAAPSARMQYSSSSFARGLVGFFAWAMPPVIHGPGSFALFPSPTSFESHVPDTVLDRALLPALRSARYVLRFARYIQHGRMQIYLVYLGVTLVALLAWSAR